MAMTWDQYWARLVEKNPALANESGKMTLTVASFKRSMQKAHEAGSGGVTGESKPLDMFLDTLFGGI